MEQSTNVGPDRTEASVASDVCHICECEFSLDAENGACGHINAVLVVFCPACHVGLYDMYRNWYKKNEDDKIVLQSEMSIPISRGRS